MEGTDGRCEKIIILTIQMPVFFTMNIRIGCVSRVLLKQTDRASFDVGTSINLDRETFQSRNFKSPYIKLSLSLVAWELSPSSTERPFVPTKAEALLHLRYEPGIPWTSSIDAALINQSVFPRHGMDLHAACS